MAETRIPAEVFHPAQMIADEAIARGWSIWDFVERIGTLDARLDVLTYQLYATCANVADLRPGRMHDTFGIDMERAFGTSAEMWHRTVALCRAHPDRIAPLNAAALAWYDLADEVPA